MSTITISNLCSAGSILFTDEESFLSELTNDEASLASGGLAYYYSCFCTKTTVLTIPFPVTRPYSMPTPPVVL